MAAASKRKHPRMECLFRTKSSALLLLLAVLFLSGCVSMRFDMVTDGAEVPPPAAHLHVKMATLAEVLRHYGAPTDVVDMGDKFALIYQRSFYQGGQISFGIPLSDIYFQSNLKLEATGNLLRHDLLYLFFSSDGILAEVAYEKGAAHPFWGSIWK